jgi:hypothetical protein
MIVLLALALTASGALAQETTAAPAAAPATSASASAPAAGAKFSTDTPLGDLLADAQAKAVLDKDLPGLTALPQLDAVKTLSLKQLQPYANGKLTDDMLTKTNTDLAAIK